MQNANNFFGKSNGSENLWRYSFTSFIYTDGIKTMAQDCQAYWLIDLIISHQTNQKVNQQPFQVWELKRANNNVFNIVANDGNDNKIASQKIPFSDFCYDSATIWLVDGCLMFPCEY